MMNELLLNCHIGGLFLTMGLPTLDPVMTSVLDYIHQHALFLGSWGGFAKALGLILAMCVTSYECWMMMLGIALAISHTVRQPSRNLILHNIEVILE